MYEKTLFAKGTAASFGAVTLVGMLVMSSGMAYAMPVAGAGGFTIKANKITSQSLLIYPGTDKTGNGSTPVAVVEQRHVRIKGMRLIKTLNVKSIPGLSGNMRLVITTAGTVRADKQVMKFTDLKAQNATFNGQVLNTKSSSDPFKRFSITGGSTSESYHGRSMDINKSDAPAQVLTNATIKGRYLVTNQISMPGMQFSVQYDSNGDGKYDKKLGSTASKTKVKNPLNASSSGKNASGSGSKNATGGGNKTTASNGNNTTQATG